MIDIATSSEKLWERVESRIREGWISQRGGVSVANGSNLIFIQAIILKSE